jgi:hypothetical protein
MFERGSPGYDVVLSRMPSETRDRNPDLALLYDDLDSLEAVAYELGMDPMELEERLLHREVFGIEEDGVWLIPRKQFVKIDGSFAIDTRLTGFFTTLREQFPLLSGSPWVMWRILFSSLHEWAGQDHRLPRNDNISLLLDIEDDEELHKAINKLRETLTTYDRSNFAEDITEEETVTSLEKFYHVVKREAVS